MTILLSAQGTIVLEGTCPSEDAEILLQHLANDPETVVDLRTCEAAHAAVIQVLMAATPVLQGPPPDSPVWRWIYPVITPAK